MKLRLALGLLLACQLLVFAGDRKTPVDGKVSRENTKTVLEKIAWHTSIDAALETARKDGKLLFWIQLKGKLDGFV